MSKSKKAAPAVEDIAETRPVCISILGKVYAVEWLDRIYDEEGEQSGTSSARHQIIKVSTSHHLDDQRDTLLHEVLHAIDEQLKLDLSETQVALLSTGLFQVFRAAPDFAEFVTE